MNKPTNKEILEALDKWGGAMTYVVRNILGQKYKGLKTPLILRRLKALELAGKVERMRTDYKTQICWRVVMA
jgi:hypothetical protein